MPNMDGLEATRLQSWDRGLPERSTNDDPTLDGDLERCLAAGMNDYIAKPIHPDQLFSTMARYLVDVPVRVSLAGTDGMVGNRPRLRTGEDAKSSFS